VLNLLFVAASTAYLVGYLRAATSLVHAITLDTINLVLLTLGFLLHGTPARLMRAVREATPAVWGVILQFPLYAGIASVITKTHLNAGIARFYEVTKGPAKGAASAFIGWIKSSAAAKKIISSQWIPISG